MRRPAVLAALVLAAAACVSHPAFDAHGPVWVEPLREGAVIVPATVTRGMVLVPTWIDGRGPYSFVLDSGASTVVVSERCADRAGLRVERREGTILTEAGHTDGAMLQASVRELRLGGARFRRLGVLVADLDGLSRGVGRAVDGLLGAPVMSHHLWTVDLDGGTVVIADGALPAADGVDILPVTMDGGLPTLRIEVAGRALDAILDTGQRMAVALGPRDAAMLRPRLRVIGESVGHVLDGEVRRDVAQLDGDVRIGGISLRAPQVVLGQATRLGTAAFPGRILTFDLPNARFRAAPR